MFNYTGRLFFQRSSSLGNKLVSIDCKICTAQTKEKIIKTIKIRDLTALCFQNLVLPKQNLQQVF